MPFSPKVNAKLKAQGALSTAPLVEILRRNWREIVLTALLRTGQQVPFYVFTTYIITYGTQQLGFSRGIILNFVMIQSLISMMTIPIMGHLADRYGRRNITALGCVVMIMYPFVYFSLVDTRAVGPLFLAVAIGLLLHDLQYGPQAVFIAESFPRSLRYSSSSLGYQIASITAGGPAQILAVILLREFGTSTAIAIYVSA